MSNLVLYHGKQCRDGFTAAWLFETAPYLDHTALRAANYGYEPPDCTDKDVYIVDFCYPRETIAKMAEQARRIVILDHHKTAIENMAGFEHPRVQLYFDTNRSGAMLAYDYLRLRFGDAMDWVSTDFLGYIQDRDLWQWRLPHSREINAYIRSRQMTRGVWETLNQCFKDKDNGAAILRMTQAGTAILMAEDQLVEDHLPHAYEIELTNGAKTYVGLAVNATVLQSEIAAKLAGRLEGISFGACFIVTREGGQIWSLRSAAPDGIDVAAVARNYGGGGHKHAAGFQLAPGGIIPRRY